MLRQLEKEQSANATARKVSAPVTLSESLAMGDFDSTNVHRDSAQTLTSLYHTDSFELKASPLCDCRTGLQSIPVAAFTL